MGHDYTPLGCDWPLPVVRGFVAYPFWRFNTVPYPARHPLTTTAAIPAGLSTLLGSVAEKARASGLFGEVELTPATAATRLSAAAKASAAPAWYRLEYEQSKDQGQLWAAIVTPDRWLSHSLEADLTHTGDKLDELLAEELEELGWNGEPPRLRFDHFRDEQKMFTFRSPLPITPQQMATTEGIRLAELFLFGYEACFRRLGDMEKEGE